MLDNQILLEAIALKKCVKARYNRVDMTLAPHILYRRNDSFYVDAVALEKNGAPPREKKLGAFHLGGLSELGLSEQHFEVEALFDPQAEKYATGTLFVVEI